MGKTLFTFSKKTRPNKEYNVGEVLGSGQFSQVFHCTRKSDDKVYALKKIAKKGSTVDEMVKEVEIMQKIDHPNILKLEDVYETDHDLYLVLELATGGELFDQIVERQFYSEKDTADLLVDILKCLEYLHKNSIVHRDLKPENLLYSDKKYSVIKIADFGLAKESEANKMLYGVCGTPGYMAPEMVHFEGYTSKADIFSLGVILYILLCGFPPFDEDEFEWEFVSPEWDGISADAKDLVSKMMAINPSKRPTATECLAHPWLSGNASSEELKETQLALKKFQARRRFKKGITAVRTTNFLRKLVGQSQSKKEEESLKYFRVMENSLSEALKNIETVADSATQSFEVLASASPEKQEETLPLLRDVFKQMHSMEHEFKAIREAYHKAFLPAGHAEIADWM